MLNFSDMTAPVFKMISTERAFILEHITAVQKVLERLWGPLFPELPGLLNYLPFACRLVALLMLAPFALCIALDLVAYAIARTLHLSISQQRVAHSPSPTFAGIMSPDFPIVDKEAPLADDPHRRIRAISALSADQSSPSIPIDEVPLLSTPSDSESDDSLNCSRSGRRADLPALASPISTQRPTMIANSTHIIGNASGNANTVSSSEPRTSSSNSASTLPLHSAKLTSSSSTIADASPSSSTGIGNVGHFNARLESRGPYSRPRATIEAPHVSLSWTLSPASVPSEVVTPPADFVQETDILKRDDFRPAQEPITRLC